MNKKEFVSVPELNSTISCELLGKELNQALKQLKVAFPKRKAEKERASVMIYGLTEGLRFALPGADVLATAKVSDEFVVVIPWQRFKHTFVETWKATEVINLEFSDQCMCVNRVAVRSPEIKFHSKIDKNTACNNEPSQNRKPEAKLEEAPANPDTVAPPSKPALLDAHFYMKKYGFRQFLANRDFVDQQSSLRRALDEASRILEPIGITRSDIEHMIEEKIKQMPGYETDDNK